MSKEYFLALMELIIKYETQRTKVDEFFYEQTGEGYPDLTKGLEFLSGIVELLEEILEAPETVSWWLWDTPRMGELGNIKTPEDLWESIKEAKKQK